MKSRGDAAYLGEMSSVLGDRLIVHASDEGARIDLDVTFRALPAGCDCHGLWADADARRGAARLEEAGRAPADLRFETFGSSGLLRRRNFACGCGSTDAELVAPHISRCSTCSKRRYRGDSDCRRGECGVCAVNIIGVEGTVDHRDVFFSEQQRRDNRKICPCVSRAVGVVTVDPLYRPEATHR